MKYEFDTVHPYYQLVIPEIIERLVKKYPRAELHTVKLSENQRCNFSLGNANVKGVISLNPYWFEREPSILKQAAKSDYMMPLGNGEEAGYHGKMIEEPLHVITHEFGHILSDNVPGWQVVASKMWTEATKKPELAPAVYALANPIEYWAELFAASELNLSDSPHVKYMRSFLGVEE